jgi:hypothetical protein
MVKNIISTLTVVLFAGSVFAASTSSDNRSSARAHYASTHSDEGFFPSVGVGFGHMDQSGNSNVDGDGISAQLIGSYYFGNSNWIADAGLGFRKQYFKGTDSQPTVGLLSLDGRYDFGNRYSLGPIADILIGNGEDFGTSNKYVTMLGIVGLKEFTIMNDQMIRAGLKYTSEVGQSDQTSNFVGLVVEWGIGSQNTYVKSAGAY